MLQKNSATTDEEIYTESHSLEKERYLPESEQSLDTCMSGLTTCIRSGLVPPTVSYDALHVRVYVWVCVRWSVSHCLLSSLRIPLKVLLSLSTRTNDTPWCHSIFPALLLISLPVFPWTFSAPVFLCQTLSSSGFLLFRHLLSVPTS